MPVVDHVLRAYSGNYPIEERLRVVQLAIAEAAAELSWLRAQQDDYKADELLGEARAITRRIRGLRRLVEVDVAEHRAERPAGIDPASPEGSVVLQMFCDRIVGIAHDVLVADVAAELERRFAAAVAADPDIPWPPAEPPPAEPPEPEAAA